MKIRRAFVASLAIAIMLCNFSAQGDVAPVTPTPPSPASALTVPTGYRINVFAQLNPARDQYFRGPRSMVFGSDDNLYLSLGLDNKVVMLPDTNHDGQADNVITVSDKLNGPQGLAFVEGKLYVANQDGVVRLEKTNGQWPTSEVTPIIPNLPSGGHTLKTLKMGPDGYLYLNVGSSCNVCIETDPLRATILRYSINGSPAGALVTYGRHAQSPIWASGLRNTEGFAWNPQTGDMIATNNGADMRSNSKSGSALDALPPEHINRIEAGKNYGWPHCWGDHVTDPNFPGPSGFCEQAQTPIMTLPAHAAPLGIAFLDKTTFPKDLRNDALVALHGSWNRELPSGYKVVKIHFDHGKPVSISDFITGWLTSKGAWGRPVDIITGPDGAVYLSDDRAGLVYRITYVGQ